MSLPVTVADDSADSVDVSGLVPLRRSRTVTVSAGSCTTADDVTSASSALVRRLRDEAVDGVLATARTIVVLVVPPAAGGESRPAFRNALIQSLRGVVQSVTREFAHRAEPVNLLVVDRDDIRSAEPTLRYLDEADGGYTAGFTFDITGVTA